MPKTRYKVLKYLLYFLGGVFLCVLQNTPGLFVIAGVKPMLVSITRPSWIAAIEEPFPIWQVTILMSSSGWCIKCAQ